MQLRKDITFFDTEVISIVYTKQEFQMEDTAIAVYDKYKISILLSEGLHAVLDKKIISGKKNSVLFFRPDELHFGRMSRSGVHSYLDIFIPVTFFARISHGEEAAVFLNDRSKERINCISLERLQQETIADLAKQTIEILQSEGSPEDLRLFSIILQVILLCNDHYETEKNKKTPDDMPKIVAKTMRYISENFEKQLTLTELAADANCSVAYLSRIFKQHTGMTIYQYITAIRIANAQILLRKGLSVTEVCFAAGFNDCSNFICKFKKVTGITPLKFQKI